MEFKALGIGVIDIRVDNFNLRSVAQVLGRFYWRKKQNKTKHAFPALCKGHRNGKQFPGRHGLFDIHLCLSKHVLGQCTSNKTSKSSRFFFFVCS